jgi:hypothetical protein
MNLKCLIGLHKWVKHKYTRFSIVKKCERCGKIRREYAPWPVLAAWADACILTTLFLLYFDSREKAEAFLKTWMEKELKELGEAYPSDN